jgi:antibiotic biosynthesis monooxygenase (ABM) superfamily enzyme
VIIVTDGMFTPITIVDALMVPTLTGPFDTGRLPRIAGEPVTVTVARRVEPGFEAEFLRWADDMVAAVRQAPGCLGAAVFHPGPDGGDYQIVVRFVDGLLLRQWERSPERDELMARAERFVITSRVQRTVGVEQWFEAAAHAQPKRPWWGRLFLDVAWVYPVSMLSALFVAPHLGTLPLGARVLAGAALITLAIQAVISPLRKHLRARRRL